MVGKKFGVDIEIRPSNDPRSYRQDSSKLLATGFLPSKGVVNAIDEITAKLQSGEIKDDDRWHTVRWMTSQKIGLQ